MQIFKLHKVTNPAGFRGAKYTYQLIGPGGRTLSSYSDNKHYVAAIVRRHSGPKGVFYSVANFSGQPGRLLETKKILDDVSIVGLALIETERVLTANGQTFAVADGSAAGQKAIDWNDIPRYWKTRIAAGYPGYESAIDVIEAEIVTTETPEPASPADADACNGFERSAAVVAAVESINAAGGPFSAVYNDLMTSDGLTVNEKIYIRNRFKRNWPRFPDGKTATAITG